MANLTFSGFGANMLAPFYGSDAIEAGFAKLLTDQWVEGALSTTHAELILTGGSPLGKFTLDGRFNPASEATLLASRLNSVSIFITTTGDPQSDFVSLSNINLTISSFIKVGLTTGLFTG